MSHDGKHREFTRSVARFEDEVRSGTTTIVSGRTRDLSLRGLYVMTSRSLPVGTPCHVSLPLDGSQKELRVEVAGRVVRVEPHGIAVEFMEMELDSFHHLRNVVLCNADDPGRT